MKTRGATAADFEIGRETPVSPTGTCALGAPNHLPRSFGIEVMGAKR